MPTVESMEDAAFKVRRAHAADVDPLMDLYESVASEGKWIGGEAPIDRERWRQGFHERFGESAAPGVMLVADPVGRMGLLGNVGVRGHDGVGDLGMMVAADWRGRGVGSALLSAAVRWAEDSQLHKIALHVWPHNERARALYRRFGFAEEGHLRRHYRRRNGELWDAVVMGLVLDTSAPGCPF